MNFSKLAVASLLLTPLAVPAARADEAKPVAPKDTASSNEVTPAIAPPASATPPTGQTKPTAPQTNASPEGTASVQTAEETGTSGAHIVLAQTDVAPPSVGANGGPGGTAGSIPTGPVGGATPGTPAPGAMPGMPAGAPPLSIILGYADLMLAADRPYEAEKIYKQIQANLPKMDPNDPKAAAMIASLPPGALEGMKAAQAAVEKGLRDVAYAKRPTLTILAHGYSDDRDVRLYTYGLGPTFRTRYGRVTLTAGTGHYRNNNNPDNPNNPLSSTPDIPTAEDNDTLRKSTVNLLLEPYYKKFEGSFFFSNVTYDNAPNRFLYDLQLSYLPKPTRERFYISHGRHDSYFQNVNNQFYAPETFFQLKEKILYDDYSVGAEYPIAKRLDGTLYYRYFEYSDGNRRNNYRTQLMYRLKPTGQKPFPVWRVGLDFIFDDAKFFTLNYTSSFNFNAYSIATDYLFVSRKLKYGLYASYPVYQQNFRAPYGAFGFASYQLSKNTEIYSKLARLSGPGNSLTFNDAVIGTNIRF